MSVFCTLYSGDQFNVNKEVVACEEKPEFPDMGAESRGRPSFNQKQDEVDYSPTQLLS